MQIRGPRPLIFKQRNKGKGTYHQAKINAILNNGESETEVKLILNTGSNLIKNALMAGLRADFWVQVQTAHQRDDEYGISIILHINQMDPVEDQVPDLVLKLSDGRAQLIA